MYVCKTISNYRMRKAKDQPETRVECVKKGSTVLLVFTAGRQFLTTLTFLWLTVDCLSVCV